MKFLAFTITMNTPINALKYAVSAYYSVFKTKPTILY